MKNIIDKLQKVLFKVTGRKISLQENKNFQKELGIDSLTMVEIVLETEEMFGLAFDQSDLCEEYLKDTSSFLQLLEIKTC